MKKLIVIAAVFPFFLSMGCGEEDPGGGGCGGGGPIVKAKVDTADLASGVTVTLTNANQIGRVKVKFTVPVPNVADAAFETSMAAATTLLVEGTGSLTADLADGTLVDTPNEPNEFTWTLNATRDEATLIFVNADSEGGNGTLKTTRTYTATLTIADNTYVEAVPAASFTVTVVAQ